VAALEARRRVVPADHRIDAALVLKGDEHARRDDDCRVMPVNLIGLGLIIAGVLFMYFLNFVGYAIGLPMVLGGIVALFMTYRRKKLSGAT